MISYTKAEPIFICPSGMAKIPAGSYSKIQKLTLAHLLGKCPSGMPLDEIPGAIDKVSISSGTMKGKTSSQQMSSIYKKFNGVLFDHLRGGPRKGSHAAHGHLTWLPEVKDMTLEFVQDRAFHNQATALSKFLYDGKYNELLDKMRQSLLTGCPNGHISDFLNYDLNREVAA